ncbi:MAG: cupin domain-containing protein [Halobacteriota archaeon]
MPRRYTGARSFGTAVYYFLTAETFSAIHRVITDEIWHFYCGDSVEMLQLSPDGSGFVTTLGSDIERNATPGCRSLGDMARGTARPGWKIRFAGHDGRSRIEFTDFQLGRRHELLHSHPSYKAMIIALTRQ